MDWITRRVGAEAENKKAVKQEIAERKSERQTTGFLLLRQAQDRFRRNDKMRRG